MFPKVIVMNRPNAKKYSFHQHPEKSAIISITDPFSKLNSFNRDPSNGIIAVFKRSFEDVCRGQEGCITAKDAKDIVDFCKQWKDQIDVFIVHCEAGQCRSAGIAAAILKYYTGDDSEIFDNPKYYPNSACYSMVLEEFNQENCENNADCI